MRSILALALALAASLAACGRSETRSETTMPQTPQHSPEALSLARITPREPGAVLELLSTAIETDGAIEPRYTAYGAGVSPPLRWTPVQGAGAYAIIVEDPDAPTERPFVHWLIWNIPGGLSALPAAREIWASIVGVLNSPDGHLSRQAVENSFQITLSASPTNSDQLWYYSGRDRETDRLAITISQAAPSIRLFSAGWLTSAGAPPVALAGHARGREHVSRPKL
jgi:phosphatidylethanolamine-binding protein (PEBP) family uncharacterized protein